MFYAVVEVAPILRVLGYVLARSGVEALCLWGDAERVGGAVLEAVAVEGIAAHVCDRPRAGAPSQS